MASFLLELQTEDIPARFLPDLQRNLKDALEKFLYKNGVVYPKEFLAIWVTPGRVAIFLKDVSETIIEEKHGVQGPKANSLNDPQVLAFAKAKGLKISDLRLEETPKGKYVSYIKTIPAQKTKNILSAKLPELIWSIPFPKTMRWDSSGRRFARPIRGVLALWDDRVLHKFALLPDLKPHSTTRVAGKTISIRTAQDYSAKLEAHSLILGHETRWKCLKDKIVSAVKPNQPTSLDFKGLCEEATWLIERPEPIVGEFEPDYLELPKEAVLVILTQLKAFGVEGKAGQLLPKFIVVVEQTRKQALKNIRVGYEKVVDSKLFDAKFFWDQDRRKPLGAHAVKLEGIVWSKDLGSLKDKVERVRLFCNKETENFSLKDEERLSLDRSAQLYKADLATTLVGEYPELAGKVAYHYALHSFEESGACQILEEIAETSPKKLSQAAILLILADRLDTLVAHFSLGNKPTATEDPLGLKDIADEIIDLAWTYKLSFSLRELAQAAWETFPKTTKDPVSEVLEFLYYRIIAKLAFLGFTPDRIEAILSTERFKDLPVSAIRDCSEAFKSLQEKDYLTLVTLAGAFKRVANILRQAEKMGLSLSDGQVDSKLFQSPSEKTLWDAVGELSRRVDVSKTSPGYQEMFASIAQLANPLAKFFEEVMVLCEDETLKKNRLTLLKNLKDTVLQIIDPSKLVISDQR